MGLSDKLGIEFGGRWRLMRRFQKRVHTVEFRVGATLTGEGRDYHELFDAIAVGATAYTNDGRDLDDEGRVNHVYYTVVSVHLQARRRMGSQQWQISHLTFATGTQFQLSSNAMIELMGIFT